MPDNESGPRGKNKVCKDRGLGEIRIGATRKSSVERGDDSTQISTETVALKINDMPSEVSTE